MSIECKKCKRGTLLFFDGTIKHNPIWVCNNCDYEYNEEEFTDLYTNLNY